MRKTVRSKAHERQTQKPPESSTRRTTDRFAAVRKASSSLTGVEEGTAYGAPALKVHGTMFACLTTHRSAEPDTLAVRLDFDQRDALVAEEPETYYLTDHYVDYPCVLVRLQRIRQDALRDLLLTGWQFVSASKARGGRTRQRTGTRRKAGRS